MKKRLPILIVIIFLIAAVLSSCLLSNNDDWFYYGIEKLGKSTEEPTATDEPGTTSKPVDIEERDIPEIKRDTNGEVLTVSELYYNNVDSVVGITTTGTQYNIWGQASSTASTGTGIILSSDGYILTNNHVIEDGNEFTVALYNGETYTATLVGTEPNNDVAVIKINATNLKAATFGDSSKIVVGEDVIVIGNPLGELTYTLTRGVVSALDRLINSDGVPINMFQVDAAVNSGNSGGPAFDGYGNVIGMVTAKPASTSVDGIGFCIPINDALNIAEQLIQYGYVKGKGAMGIVATEAYTRSGWGTTRVSGAYVSSVFSGSAAEAAGIVEGMLINYIDNYTITSSSDLQTCIALYKAGAVIKVSGRYNSKNFEIEMTLGEYSPSMVPDGIDTSSGLIV